MSENQGERNHPSAEAKNTRSILNLDYAVLKIVFQNLKIRDLFSCSRVCRLWHEISQIVRRQRSNKPSTLLYHFYPIERTREVVELSNAFKISEAALLWLEDPSTSPAQRDLTKDVKTAILRNELEPALWKFVDNQFSEPCQIVCIGSPDIAPYLLKSEKQSTSNNTTTTHLFKRMGKVSPCLGALGHGLVLTMPDNTSCLENECRSRRHIFPMMSGLIIPKVTGLKISMFTYGANTVWPWRRVTAENCEQALNISPEDKVKAILLFQGRQSRPNGIFLLTAIHEYLKKHPNVSFGGGLFTEAFTNDQNNLIGCGLVISGDENIRVGSTAFLEEGITDENLRNLRKFKDFGLTGTTDFAFMFCCNGRGALMHNSEHVESNLFRSEYPSVPLIGAFTGGEYYHPYIEGQPNPGQVPERKPSSLEFGYTTVFVYVSCSR